MPIQRCKVNGKPGYRWGQSGKCYVGFGARAKAEEQAQAIYASGYTGNAFCPAGKGGGVDPTCLPGSSVQAFNIKRRKPNPLRADPSRTATIRRKFEAEVVRRFNQLKKAVRSLLLEEDAFGLMGSTHNVFCPTGKGGGVDPTCEAGGESVRPRRTPDAIVNDALDILESRGFHTQVSLSKSTSSYYVYVGRRNTIGGFTTEFTIRVSDHPKPGWKKGGWIPRLKTYDLRRRRLKQSLDRVLADRRQVSQETIDRASNPPAIINIQEEDAFGLMGSTRNVFCPTGEGGGVDPSCSPEGIVKKPQRDDPGGRGTYRIYFKADYDKPEDKPRSITVKAKSAHAALKGFNARYGNVTLMDLRTVNSEEGVKLTVNEPYRFRFFSTPEQIAAFQRWLAQQTQFLILGNTLEQIERGWWQQYVEEGYKKGAGRAFQDTRKFAKSIEMLGWYQGTQEDFLRSSFGRPVAVEKVKLLAGRTLTDLKGVTGQMATVMSRTLTDGLVQGKNPRDIAKTLDENVEGIGRNRALVIARTEIIRAHAEGNLDALEQLGVEDVGVMVEWSTAGDLRVCNLCRPLEGVIFKLEEMRGMIPRHPGCRCTPVPAQVGESGRTKVDWQKAGIEQTRGQKGIEAAIAESLDVEGKGSKTTWIGADKEISKVRPKSLVWKER